MLKKLILIASMTFFSVGCSTTSTDNTVELPQSVVGQWQIIQVGEKRLSQLGQSTINFKTDLKVSGMNACNNFFGQYQQQHDQLSFSPLGTTMKACVESLMQQERQTMQALAKVNFVKGNDSQLKLLDKNYKVLLILNRI